MVSMLQALVAANISIPYNQFDLNLREVPEALAGAVRQAGRLEGKPGTS